jgi:membrane protein implicated in regulation of membrane protease activity
MLRNVFRTVAIGMAAVAGLFLLFFVLKVLFFFLIVGFIARMVGRRWHYKYQQMQHEGWSPAWAAQHHAQQPIGRQQPFAERRTPAGQRMAVVEIYR